MYRNSIIDTNILLYLYSYDIYASSWDRVLETRIHNELEKSKNILLYPIIIKEYLDILFKTYLKTNQIKSFTKAKKLNQSINYNNGINWLKELIKDKKFKFVKTKEYLSLDDFKIEEKIDNVDSWLYRKKEWIITADKELFLLVKNKNITL